MSIPYPEASSSNFHLFGPRLPDFEAEKRRFRLALARHAGGPVTADALAARLDAGTAVA